EIAQRHIVNLGTGEDSYQAQQSIRTFFNTDYPEKAYVKTAMSVLNMGFMRGLSPQYMKATPAINDWLQELIGNDQELQNRGLAMIRETAAIGYHNHYYEAASAKGSPYRKMLSALWRESPLPLLKDGQQLATMASLLHVDAAGNSVVSALIQRSGLAPTEWLRRYFEAYLVPLVHCLYEYELAFMPHGENVILILEDGVPVRAIMKDIAEEIVVMGDRLELPDDVSRIKAEIPAEEMVLAIFTDVFDCIFRFLGAILVEDGTLREDEFWGTAAAVLREYQQRHPELADQFAMHDLFAPDFELSCLNRLQLRNNQQMLDISDPSGGLQMAGRLANPLAKFA
ncbi:MAG: IucA/IucC family C-terminal-domain containing protein, partial [Paenarthrobacter sp.]